MTPDFDSLEPVVNPKDRITFLLDWEITTKCNLDCSYCGPVGGHDNTKPHPTLDDCIKTLKFLYEYADLYMSTKPKGIRYVVLNLYGGESLHYPHIIKVLETARILYQEQYQDKWNLTITTTTNAIVKPKKFDRIVELIDEFTCSYHTEATNDQKDLFKTNLLKLKEAGKKLKCIVLMHPDSTPFQDAKKMVHWLDANQIRYLPRQLDPAPSKTQETVEERWSYNQRQVIWLKSVYDSKSDNYTLGDDFKKISDTKISMNSSGRACCGGRQLCHSQSSKERKFFVPNVFTDWYCSVNEFFVYVRQVDGEIFTNKDCKMNFNGEVGPIGNLRDTRSLLDFTENHLLRGSMPVIQCKKSQCFCGLCAPKAKDLDKFTSIMEKYHK